METGLPSGTVLDTSDLIEDCKVGFKVLAWNEQQSVFVLCPIVDFRVVPTPRCVREITTHDGHKLVAPTDLYILVKNIWMPVGALYEGLEVGIMYEERGVAFLGSPPKKLGRATITSIVEIFPGPQGLMPSVSPDGRYFYVVTEYGPFVANRFVVRFK